MSDRLCQINISDIDLTDQRYKISFVEDDITFLAQSIKETGLITPPVVRPLNNKFIIISGFNRVRAQLYNNETKIFVYKTKPDFNDDQCILTAITALAFKRSLTHAELIISCNRLCQFLDTKQVAKKSPALFNTELTARFIEDLLTIGALPDPALELIHTGNLSFKSAKRISFFDKETIMGFLSLFSNIKASTSKQVEIILHIMEISARDGISPNDLFQNQKIQDIIFNEKNDPGKKTNLVRAYLFEQRFPTLFKTRQMVQEKIVSIKLGNTIKFLPPHNFESQNYTVSFTAKNYNEFKANIHHLTTALENRALKEILNK